MANPLWPVSLPQEWLLGDSFEKPDNVLRSQTDAGPPQLRPLYTAVVTTRSLAPMILNDAQKATLESFYDDTVVGSLAFDWDAPYPGAGTLTLRFVGRPKYSHVMSDRWSVSITVEELP